MNLRERKEKIDTMVVFVTLKKSIVPEIAVIVSSQNLRWLAYVYLVCIKMDLR